MHFWKKSKPEIPYRVKLLADYELGDNSRLGLFDTSPNVDLLTAKSWAMLLAAAAESLLFESKLLSTAGLEIITETLYSDITKACDTQQLNGTLVKSYVFITEMLKLPDNEGNLQPSLIFLSKIGRQLLRIPESINIFRQDTQNILRVSYSL